MKRIVSLLFVLMLTLTVLPVDSLAVESEKITLYFDDGSYAVIETIENQSRASGSKKGQKKYTYYNGDNTAEWDVVLTGVFSFTGSSATCTSSTIDVSIYNSEWSALGKSANKSGNVASASATMYWSYNGSTKSVPIGLRLTCDANGNLS